MTKHVIDNPATRSGARMSRYVDLEKRSQQAGPHPAIAALRRQTKALSNALRNREFLRIETRQE